MKFEFNCEQILNSNELGLSIFSAETIKRHQKKDLVNLSILIDTMGIASSTAQKLSAVITTFYKLMTNTENQKLYLYWKENKCFGILKTGYK